MQDKIVIKNDTGKILEAMAHVTPKAITIRDITLDIEEGDVIYHTNPAGREEIYDVELVQYSANSHMSKALHHIAITCTKRSSLVKNSLGNTNYNIVNSNLAINSTNVKQRSLMGLDLAELEKSNPEAYLKVQELEDELKKPEKDSDKIKSIVLWVVDKVPDVLIAILSAYLQKSM